MGGPIELWGPRVGPMGIIIGLLVIWLILSIVGFVVKGLLWLAIIGLVLFVATGVWGWLKRRTNA
ncbi:hypothetical protein NicSoilC5_14510 [Arthrobacter sp. NicSoilC5]|nr:hypothetical protein NicSoilC5_14510 [Arthrobacter sp. NicSoilC5]